MSKPITNCRCGAAFDSKGFCTACGTPRPRTSGYRAWHGFWCAVATLLLVGCLTTTATVRAYLKKASISSALETVALSQVTIPGEHGQTVSGYIREEFVSDDNVLQTDVDAAVDALGLPKFAAGKLQDYADLLRGDTDKVVQVTPDEIVSLLEKNEDALYDKCLLVIEDKDKTNLRKELEGPLDTCNALLTGLYGSKALRALAHWRLSVARMLVDVLLLILVLWRWMRVCCKSGKLRDTACKAMGMTILIPSGLLFVATVVTGAGSALASVFAKDGAADPNALKSLLQAVRGPLYWNFGLWVLVGVALLLLAAVLRAITRRQQKPALTQQTPVAPTRMEAIEVPEVTPLPEAAALPDEQPIPTPVESFVPSPTAPTAQPENPCIACGKALAAGARFCIYCGSPQTDSTPNHDVLPEPLPDITTSTDGTEPADADASGDLDAALIGSTPDAEQ